VNVSQVENDVSVRVLPLKEGTRNTLMRNGIMTLGDLYKVKLFSLVSGRGIGWSKLKEICSFLDVDDVRLEDLIRCKRN
jgi:hypothetical protein